MRRISLMLSLLIASTLSSCTYRLFDFTVLSSKNVDFSKANTFIRGNVRTEGKDLSHVIIVIPTGVPNLKEAVDKAIEKVPGCVALLDGVIKERIVYAVFYAQTGYVVEGTPLIDPNIGGPKKATYSKIELNRKGEVKEIKELTKEDYFAFRNKKIGRKYIEGNLSDKE